ncbi:hypothetical protein BKI52_16980 [marine bacterium AO1-C]|nr:hypothetical protein BKI52_16980 [marine bacterium AO1-C]
MNHRHNKEIVIAKGMELFWNEGFHSLGVDKICRETGMTKGAFYNAFKSKEQFLLTTLKSYGDLIESHLQTQLANDTFSAFDKLVNLYKDMLESQLQNGFKGCFVNNMMSEMSTLNENVSKLSDEQFKRFIKVIEPTVKQAQNDGDFDDNLSAKQLSEIIHTTFFGFLTRSKSLKLSTHEPMVLFLNTLKIK